jgi:ankyrin repeat protein
MYARAILKAAVLSGNITFIEELIKHGLDINTRDHKGTTALMMATKLNNYELALFLIEHGADINQCTTSGTTPLMIACQRNALAIVQCLIENRAILDTRDTQGKTALDYTNELGVSVANTDAQDLNEKIKNLLMHHMSMQDLVDAIMGGNDERVEELLQNPVLNVDEFHEGATPLMIAALHGTTRSVAAIMSAGTQYHQANTSGQNVLLLPVTNPEIFHILLRKLYFLAGTSDHRNKTVLMNAIELHGSNKEIIDTLLEQIGKNKAYLNAQDTQGRTALGIARNLQHDYVVQRLQELGAT